MNEVSGEFLRANLVTNKKVVFYATKDASVTPVENGRMGQEDLDELLETVAVFEIVHSFTCSLFPK